MNGNNKKIISILIIAGMLLSGFVMLCNSIPGIQAANSTTTESTTTQRTAANYAMSKTLPQVSKFFDTTLSPTQRIEPSLYNKIIHGNYKSIKVQIFTSDVQQLGTALRIAGVKTTMGKFSGTTIVAPIFDLSPGLILQIAGLKGVLAIQQYNPPVIPSVPQPYAEATGKGAKVMQTIDDLPVSHQGATKAWANGFTGKNVNVAIVDTGIDFGVPDLQGTQARTNDTSSPYYGWPIEFDSGAMLYWLEENKFTGSMAGYLASGESTVVTSYSDTSFATGAINGFVTFNGITYNVSEIPSKSGIYHLGYHVDKNLAYYYGTPIAILVTDAHTIGVYDTVYVDLDNNHNFNTEKPCFKGDEISWNDNYNATSGAFDNSSYHAGDGIADLSGGMIYWIADGVNLIPYMNIYAASYGMYNPSDPASVAQFYSNYMPGNGNLVCWAGSLELNAGGSEADHGTGCAGMVTAQGVLGLSLGFAPDAKLIDLPLWAAGANTYDLWTFAVTGYDGNSTTSGDQAQVCSNSWGNSEAWDTGWTAEDRMLTYIELGVGGSLATFLVADGNGGPGYGTVTTPFSPDIVNVGAATDMGYRPFSGYEGGPYEKWGDVIPFSARGPTITGNHGPDVVSVGAYAYSCAPLSDGVLFGYPDGTYSFTLFGGTSQATPATAGICALIYGAFDQKHATFPTCSQTKSFLMGGADNINYDTFTMGAGYANADRSTKLANGINGVFVFPPYYGAGSYEGVRHTDFASIMYPGSTASTTFTIYNTNTTNSTTVQISDSTFQRIGSNYTYGFNLTDASSSNVTNIKPLIPPGTNLMQVIATTDYANFDTNNDNVAENWARIDIHDWTDLDHNGQINWAGNAELNRFTVGANEFPSVQAWVQNPIQRSHDGLIIQVRPYKFTSTFPVTVTVQFFKEVDCPWITENVTSAYIPANSFNTVKTKVIIPSNAEIGAYEGALLINNSGNITTVPLNVEVASPTDQFTFGGNYTSDNLFDNNYIHGTVDWQWYQEAGDWRHYFFNVTSADANDMFYLDLNWTGKMTDIDAYVLGPTDDSFSDSIPSIYGPYTLSTIAMSQLTSVGGTGQYLYQTSTGGPEEILSGKLKAGLNEVVIHDVLYNGTGPRESFTGKMNRMYVYPQDFATSYNLDTHTNVTGIVPVRFKCTTPIDNISVTVQPVKTTDLKNQPIVQNPNTANTWDGSWQQALALTTGQQLSVHIDSATASDLDLYLFQDTNGNGVPDSGDTVVAISAGSTATEAFSYTITTNGTYFIVVNGYNVASGGATFNIGISLTTNENLFSPIDVPTGTIAAGKEYEFNVTWNLPPEGGIVEGLVYIGSLKDPTIFEVPITITINDLAPPLLYLLSPISGTTVNTAYPLIQAQIDDSVVYSGIDQGSVKLFLDGQDITSFATIDAKSGLVSYQTSYALHEGTHTLDLQATDGAGNPGIYGTPAPWVFSVDTVNPIVTLTSPQDNSWVKDQVSITGYVSDITAQVMATGISTPIPVNTTTGMFGFVEPFTSDGNHVIVVQANDTAGNIGLATLIVNSDNTTPVLTISSPVNSTTNTQVFTVSGMATDNGSGISFISVNGIITVPDNNGQFSANIGLMEGINNIIVKAYDNVGNTATQTVTVTLDSIPPSLSLDPIRAYQNTMTITITGSTDAKSVTVNGNSATVTGGKFSSAVAFTSEGQNTITVVATGAAGNQKTATESFMIDTVAPTATEILNPAKTLTNNPIVTVNGTAQDTGSGIAALYVDGVSTQVINGHYSTQIRLNEGSNVINVTAVDMAGNYYYTTKSITLDTTPPSLTITSVTSSLSSDQATIQGITEVGANVKVNGQSVTVNSDGSFTGTVSLSEGSNEITVVATDSAGNSATAIREVTYLPEINTMNNWFLALIVGLVVIAVLLGAGIAAAYGSLNRRKLDAEQEETKEEKVEESEEETKSDEESPEEENNLSEKSPEEETESPEEDSQDEPESPKTK